ncbi:MAG TPA: DNA polymerase III subunit gamma/tau [Candidatus Sulfotelmatobacter sp.]|nr:DNA polymerase III subunit gamma/tau [Candidatus Sulfotelmatobacter sp.]
MPSATSHLAIYRRWRAQTFGQMVGQAAVVETLRNAVRLDRLSHGFLFVGPRGTGKTSMARILAKAVNCPNAVDGEPDDTCEACAAIREGRALDVVEIDAASNNTVDDMRELLPRVYTATADLRRKVFIIDEVQRITQGWDVLLRTLEDPPDDVLFIFCTTEPSKIRPAVLSRVQRFTFRPLTVAEISGKLERILADEGRNAEPAAVALVADLAAGGMRDAESMLDQLLAADDQTLTVAAVRDMLGLADEQAVRAFVEALVRPDPLAGIRLLDVLEAQGRDLIGFADQVVVAMRRLLVERLAGRSTEDPTLAAVAPTRIAEIARRLAALDANRIGAGGYRFQLELILLEQGSSGDAPVVPAGAAAAPAKATVAASAVTTPVARTDSPKPARAAAAAPAKAGPTAKAAPVAVAPLAAAPQAASSAPAPGEEALERLRQGWPEFVERVSANPMLKPVVAACRPVEVRDGIVVLGFPEETPFYREKAEQRRAALEAGVEAVLGRAYGVRCVTTNLEALPPLPVKADDPDLVARFREIFAGELADVAEIS